MNLNGKKALVMGLGLHGGGVESARYLAKRGAHVLCTDLRSAEVLAPSIQALEGLNIEFILGEHRQKDFDDAHIIVKNPAVPIDSPWIMGRQNIETDISLFLKEFSGPILAVTGSKGKSTTVTALHHFLSTRFPQTRLGGNITVSPLSFLEELNDDTPVILELSSWQLADLRGKNLLHPQVATITNLMHDHQNRYESFEDYEADKWVICESLPQNALTVFPDDERGQKWATDSTAPSFLIRDEPPQSANFQGAWIDSQGLGWVSVTGEAENILPSQLPVPGLHQKRNLLFAALMARLFGLKSQDIHKAAQNFPGVPYRMELFLESQGIRFYDDTAATIPDATAAAVNAVSTASGTPQPVILIAGGTDKELDFTPFTQLHPQPKAIILLPGTATKAIQPLLEQRGHHLIGPVESMDQAIVEAQKISQPGDAVLLSPGAASFGLFTHEFHRGDAFKAACRKYFSE